MIWISKSELREMAMILMLANTPNSLLKGLLDCQAVRRMRSEVTPVDLYAYYESLTARAKRSEISLAFMYGAFVGLLYNKDQTRSQIVLDETHLSWGAHIKEIAKTTNSPTSFQIITPAYRPSVSNQPVTNLIVPISWGNK